MNKGCVAYFSEGLKTAKNTFLKNKKNFFKYYLFFIASILGSAFLVTLPVFLLANIRIARIAKEKNEIEILNSLEGADHPKRWWTLLLSNYLWLVLVIAGVVAIGLCFSPTLPFLASLTNLDNAIALVVFASFIWFVFYIVLIIYIILATLHFAPVNYIIDKDKTLGVSDVLKTSYNSMSKNGKASYFGINFLYGLVTSVFFFIFGILLIVFIALGTNMPSIGLIFLALFMGIILLLILLVLPLILLGQSISILSLFDDIIQIEEKEIEDIVDNSEQNTQKVQEEVELELSTDELLESLFAEEE